MSYELRKASGSMPMKRIASKEERRWHRFFPVLSDADEQRESEALELHDAPTKQSLLEKYKDYPLAQSMLAGESTRNQILIRDGRKQGEYAKSNDGWLKTLFVIEVW